MEITPDKWQRAKALFDAALQQAPADRAAFLARTCPEDDLRAQVEELLCNHEQAGSFLSKPVFDFPEAKSLVSGRKKLTPLLAHDITALLQAWGSGDDGALERLMPLVYQELHRLARHYMAGEQPGGMLQTTALVHEVYFRLVDVENIDWQDRAHFYGICSRLMRRVLIDFARSRNYQKRGGRFTHIELEEAAHSPVAIGSEILAVDEALTRLAAVDSRKSEVVELHFFGGLTLEEIAATLRVSSESVKRDWKLAKAWLTRELKHELHHDT